MSSENKHLEELAAIQALTGDNSWSSWGSPIGLTIFFIGIAVFAILIRYAFLMK